MKDLSPSARRLLDMGRDAGEPDDASLARGRAALMMRVGGAVAAGAAVTTVATTATAVPLSAATAATATSAAAPLAATASIAPAAPLAASVPLVATPLLVKVAATMVLAITVSAGGMALVSAPRANVASPVVSEVARAATAPASLPPAARASTAGRDVPASPLPAPVVADLQTEARAATPQASPPSIVAAPSRAPSLERPEAPVVPAQDTLAAGVASSLASDVASLREAQAALVQGNPRGAMEAADRVQATGPLAEEREGIRILAACALGNPEARAQATVFVERRPQAPVALRVRAACLAEK